MPKINAEILKPFLDSLKALYASMDGAYGEVSAHYGFDCGGCVDNCCTQRFYHYTLAEHIYLIEGLKKTDSAHSAVIVSRAKEVVGRYKEELALGKILPLMCPVNFYGLCSLYEHRPMICRLHGLPHEFTAPDGAKRQSGGCLRFDGLEEIGKRLDRTPFYAELAGIEKRLRAETGFSGRIKKTTAELLLEADGF